MPRTRQRRDVIAIGASAGGIAALSAVLGGLSEQLVTPILVVLHTQVHDMQPMISILAQRSGRAVREALSGTRVEKQAVYLAPGGYHVLAERDGSLSLSVDERVSHARPSIDVLFESVADAYADAAIGVLLTGSNADGARGLARLRQAGGYALVQEPATAEFPEMPQAALDIAGADAVLPLNQLAGRLNELCTP